MYIPPGFGTVTPYFFVTNADAFISFLINGLAGKEALRTLRPDGKIANAQIVIGTSTVMVSEASTQYPAMIASYYLYVEDAHTTINDALNAGATLEMEVQDMPYGDRQGGIKDPNGNIWWVSQRLVSEPYTN